MAVWVLSAVCVMLVVLVPVSHEFGFRAGRRREAWLRDSQVKMGAPNPDDWFDPLLVSAPVMVGVEWDRDKR